MEIDGDLTWWKVNFKSSPQTQIQVGKPSSLEQFFKWWWILVGNPKKHHLVKNPTASQSFLSLNVHLYRCVCYLYRGNKTEISVHGVSLAFGDGRITPTFYEFYHPGNGCKRPRGWKGRVTTYWKTKQSTPGGWPWDLEAPTGLQWTYMSKEKWTYTWTFQRGPIGS